MDANAELVELRAQYESLGKAIYTVTADIGKTKKDIATKSAQIDDLAARRKKVVEFECFLVACVTPILFSINCWSRKRALII